MPVRRRPRKDGRSEAKQRLFIEVLADTACAEVAARTVGMSVQSAYALRRAPGGEAFGEAWSAAIHQGAHKLVDIAFDRAIHGSDESVFNKEGDRVGRRMRQNDRLLMFLLRAHLPERYRHAHRDFRSADEAPAPAPPSLAAAIARLEPHRLLSEHELDLEVEVADLCEGELPHWYRAEAPQDPPVQFPLGEAFERELEAAKAGSWRLDDWEQPKD